MIDLCHKKCLHHQQEICSASGPTQWPTRPSRHWSHLALVHYWGQRFCAVVMPLRFPHAEWLIFEPKDDYSSRERRGKGIRYCCDPSYCMCNCMIAKLGSVVGSFMQAKAGEWCCEVAKSIPMPKVIVQNVLASGQKTTVATHWILIQHIQA